MFKVQHFIDGSKLHDLDGEFPTLAKALGATETAAEKPGGSGRVTSYRIVSDGGVTELEAQITGGRRRFVQKNILKPAS